MIISKSFHNKTFLKLSLFNFLKNFKIYCFSPKPAKGFNEVSIRAEVAISDDDSLI